MNSQKHPFVSVILTSYNETKYLDSILHDLSIQTYPENFLEILVLEAGNYPEIRAKKYLKQKSTLLKYLQIPNLSRTASLNLLVKKSKGDLIVRIDVRSHIKSDYLERITEQSIITKATNVGGVKVPIGKSFIQKIIAKSMNHPLCFGGGKFRNPNFKGEAETVYLGAFNKNKMPPEPWFDEKHPKISEDSDLNYRIKKFGGNIYINSEIRVEYYCRETLKEFFNLCYNYGVGRGLFVIKHTYFSAWRQLIPPLSFFISIFLLVYGVIDIFYLKIFLMGLLSYLGIIGGITFKLSHYKPKRWGLLMISFIGCHLYWTIGFFNSFRIYKKDLSSKISPQKNI